MESQASEDLRSVPAGREMPLMQVLIQTFLHVGLRKGDAERIDPTVEQILGRKPRTMTDYTRDNRELWIGQ